MGLILVGLLSYTQIAFFFFLIQPRAIFLWGGMAHSSLGMSTIKAILQLRALPREFYVVQMASRIELHFGSCDLAMAMLET